MRRTVLERAVLLKAARCGDGGLVKPGARPLFTELEVKMMACECELPDSATDAILAAFPVPPALP